MANPKWSSTQIEETLRQKALSYPGAHEEFPWGERAVKVGKKAFLFMRAAPDSISLSVKLPHSRDLAFDLPFAEPTHYGLGKHGWITATLTVETEVPLDLIESWIDESYRAIAPKKLVATLDQGAAAPGAKPAGRTGKRTKLA